MRRIVFIATLVLVTGVAFYFWRSTRVNSGPAAGPAFAGRAKEAPRPHTPSALPAAAPVAAGSPRDRPSSASGTPPWSAADFPIVAPLNAAGSTIARDLDVVRLLFDAWQSNFPHEGNPVGENAEITAALMGENRLQLALIPKGHPAVDSNGELCDRWGTPFRFHQISGTRMEIRSAGPDRRFATEDDALWSPP